MLRYEIASRYVDVKSSADAWRSIVKNIIESVLIMVIDDTSLYVEAKLELAEYKLYQ